MAGGQGQQGKRLSKQAQKEREDALLQLAAKRKREEFEKALQAKEREAPSGRRLFDKDADAQNYYNGAPPDKRRTPPSSGGSVRSSAFGASRGRGNSAAEEETELPGGPAQYPGWGAGDGFEGQDLDEGRAPFQQERVGEEDEDLREEQVEEGDGSDGSDELERPPRAGVGRRGPRNEPPRALALVGRNCKEVSPTSRMTSRMSAICGQM